MNVHVSHTGRKSKSDLKYKKIVYILTVILILIQKKMKKFCGLRVLEFLLSGKSISLPPLAVNLISIKETFQNGQNIKESKLVFPIMFW